MWWQHPRHPGLISVTTGVGGSPEPWVQWQLSPTPSFEGFPAWRGAVPRTLGSVVVPLENQLKGLSPMQCGWSSGS